MGHGPPAIQSRGKLSVRKKMIFVGKMIKKDTSARCNLPFIFCMNVRKSSRIFNGTFKFILPFRFLSFCCFIKYTPLTFPNCIAHQAKFMNLLMRNPRPTNSNNTAIASKLFSINGSSAHATRRFLAGLAGFTL